MLCIRPLLEVLRWPPVVWILQADFLLLVMRMPVLSSMTLEAQGRHLFFFIQMLHLFKYLFQICATVPGAQQ